MPRFTIPLLLTVEAENYDKAFDYAQDLAGGIGVDGENVSAEHVYHHLWAETGEPHACAGRVLYFNDLGA